MRRFYYEKDEDGTYQIVEEAGGYEHGAFYDVCICWVVDEQDAEGLVKLLHELQVEIV
jgi:hypothetical protein